MVAYEAIANSGQLSGRATLLMRALLDDDRQHAAQLVTALDGMGVKAPIPPRRATIPGLAAVHDDLGAADFAIALEARAMGAYLEAVPNLGDANLLRTLAGAMGTDGQHLVVLRQLARRPAVPKAFERGIRPSGSMLGDVFQVGPMEIVVVAIIALIVLGPAKLPDAARAMGKGMREFKGALAGEDDETRRQTACTRTRTPDADRAARAAAPYELARPPASATYQKEAFSKVSSSSSIGFV